MTETGNDAPEDYELDLQEGVDDEADNDTEDIVGFNITSYGADYTVDSLVKRLNTGAFFVPPFQRAYIWNQNQASRFIESLLLGLPVPGIFLYKEPDTNKHLIIDGQQRLKTLQYFWSGLFFEKKFRLTNISKKWLGKTYEELEEPDRQKLEDSIVHATIFQQDEPRFGDQSIYYVFERINTGGLRLSSQEIRVCLNYGPFAKMLHDVNAHESWRDIFGSPSKRLKDQELILRFFAFYFSDVTYERPMNVFFNNFMAKNRNLNVRPEAEFVNAFKSSIDCIRNSVGERAFRPRGTLNAAVFDSVMVATARRLGASPITQPESFLSCYSELLADPQFAESINRSTADEVRVMERMKLAYDYISKAR
ncbi:hypothetical protein ACVME8_010646 [Bradyrhizobium diazoefficiens]